MPYDEFKRTKGVRYGFDYEDRYVYEYGANGQVMCLRLVSYSPRCSSPCCFRHWRRTEMNLTKYVLRLDRKRYYAPSLFRVLSPTLPGDFSRLYPALRAAGKILTKYNVAHWLE